MAGANGAEPCLPAELGTDERPVGGTGTQTLLAYSSLENPTGTFRLYVQQLTHPQGCTPLTVGGAAKAAAATAAGDVACLTFQGKTAQTVNVTLSSLKGSLEPLIDDFAPAGSSVCATPALSMSCTLSAGGKWTTLIWDSSVTSKGTGTFDVRATA